MTCKDCIHHNVCQDEYKDKLKCSDFKNKADFVEVVRCKDCKYFTKEMIGDSLECTCTHSLAMVGITTDKYCSYGERK